MGCPINPCGSSASPASVTWVLGMAPKAVTMGAAVMGKSALADALATGCELKKKAVTKVLASLAEIATAELKKNSVFSLPGLCRIKTRKKPATKAGKKEIFGKLTMVKAKPAKTVVKAFAVAALKKAF